MGFGPVPWQLASLQVTHSSSWRRGILQTRIGARHDGARRLSSATVSALQAYLNKR